MTFISASDDTGTAIQAATREECRSSEFPLWGATEQRGSYSSANSAQDEVDHTYQRHHQQKKCDQPTSAGDVPRQFRGYIMRGRIGTGCCGIIHGFDDGSP